MLDTDDVVLRPRFFMKLNLDGMSRDERAALALGDRFKPFTYRPQPGVPEPPRPAEAVVLPAWLHPVSMEVEPMRETSGNAGDATVAVEDGESGNAIEADSWI